MTLFFFWKLGKGEPNLWFIKSVDWVTPPLLAIMICGFGITGTPP